MAFAASVSKIMGNFVYFNEVHTEPVRMYNEKQRTSVAIFNKISNEPDLVTNLNIDLKNLKVFALVNNNIGSISSKFPNIL